MALDPNYLDFYLRRGVYASEIWSGPARPVTQALANKFLAAAEYDHLPVARNASRPNAFYFYGSLYEVVPDDEMAKVVAEDLNIAVRINPKIVPAMDLCAAHGIHRASPPSRWCRFLVWLRGP